MSPASGKSDLPLRLVSALILGVFVLAITWAGGTYFRVLMAIAALLIYREWSTITSGGKGSAGALAGWLFVALAATAIIAGYTDHALIICAVAAVSLGVLGIVTNAGLWVAGGVIYSLIPAVALTQIRDASQGLTMIILLFVIVWGTDIGAYFAGRAIGGPKLAPAISPKKTWSGFFGGLAAAVIGAMILLNYVGRLPLSTPLLMAGGLSVISQMGDLFESWIKRRFNVKDSGQLIPGHGGIMDRVDGLVVAAVALFVLLVAGYNG